MRCRPAPKLADAPASNRIVECAAALGWSLLSRAPRLLRFVRID
jgi:hypothetical protein